MGQRAINSNLYISIGGDSSLFDENARNNIYKTFERIFNGCGKKVSDITEENCTEMIFQIGTPIMREETLMRDFFEKLEAILEALKDYNPHFTQFKEVTK